MTHGRALDGTNLSEWCVGFARSVLYRCSMEITVGGLRTTLSRRATQTTSWGQSPLSASASPATRPVWRQVGRRIEDVRPRTKRHLRSTRPPSPISFRYIHYRGEHCGLPETFHAVYARETLLEGSACRTRTKSESVARRPTLKTALIMTLSRSTRRLDGSERLDVKSRKKVHAPLRQLGVAPTSRGVDEIVERCGASIEEAHSEYRRRLTSRQE